MSLDWVVLPTTPLLPSDLPLSHAFCFYLISSKMSSLCWFPPQTFSSPREILGNYFLQKIESCSFMRGFSNPKDWKNWSVMKPDIWKPPEKMSHGYPGEMFHYLAALFITDIKLKFLFPEFHPNLFLLFSSVMTLTVVYTLWTLSMIITSSLSCYSAELSILEFFNHFFSYVSLFALGVRFVLSSYLPSVLAQLEVWLAYGFFLLW